MGGKCGDGGEGVEEGGQVFAMFPDAMHNMYKLLVQVFYPFEMSFNFTWFSRFLLPFLPYCVTCFQ